MNTCTEDRLHDIRCNLDNSDYSLFMLNLKMITKNEDSDFITEDQIKEAWKRSFSTFNKRR